MIITTVKEALDMADEDCKQCIYFYRDGDTIFYIGRSDAPFERLCQHMGMGTSHGLHPDGIGQLIIDNKPESMSWQITVASIQELVPDICKQRPDGDKEIAIWLEKELIKHHKPCRNSIGNKKRTPLPEKYNKRPIANEGVKITGED